MHLINVICVPLETNIRIPNDGILRDLQLYGVTTDDIISYHSMYSGPLTPDTPIYLLGGWVRVSKLISPDANYYPYA